jgi:hypothetical protein
MIVADELRWRYEVTRPSLPPIEQALEWALQRQNRRIVQALPTDRISVERRARVATMISVLGLVAIGALYLLDPRAARRQPAFFVLATLVFVGGLVAARSLPRIRAWSRRVAGRMIARQAARAIAGVAKRAPYTIDYHLAGDVLDAHVVSPPLDRRLALRGVGQVLYAEHVLFVFTRKHAARPSRLLFVPGEPERAALLAAFARCDVPAEELTGAVEGYAPPIAPAIVHRT